MVERRRYDRFKLHAAAILAVLFTFCENLSVCSSLNGEGLALLRFRERVVRDPFGALSNWSDNDGDLNPCLWFGVECSDGKVVILNLKDLCLEGTLAPELGELAHVKSIILRNNSFFGNIPNEIGNLKELEVLDLGYNNFSGPFPNELGNNLSLSILLLDNNKFLGSISPELYDLKMLSEFQVDENQLTSAAFRASCISRSSSWNFEHHGDESQRRLLAVADSPNKTKPKRNTQNREHSPSPSPSPLPSPSPSPSPFSSISSPSESPFSLPPQGFWSPSPSPLPPPPAPASSPPANPPITTPSPPQTHPSPAPSSFVSAPTQNLGRSSKSGHHKVLIWSGVIAGFAFIFLSALSIVFCRNTKGVAVKPWATGLSGQLQKAFVTGVPKLQRSELETACEDFSNIIGSLSDGTVYKGTLSNGVEIAVASAVVKSAEDWTKNLETQFRNKIDTLSKVNHKNFVNLIGFCEEEQPFTRMMVFEYAPNGTLFEHLHIKESEHLDWGMRVRIAMGMAYCLEYTHSLTPPLSHGNLQSSSIYLTEDYAAKISDFSFWNKETASSKLGSTTTELLETPLADPESNIYSFGVILFEMITGRIPYSVDNGSLHDWASDYLSCEEFTSEMIDPTLKSFQQEEGEKLFEVIKDCVHHDPKQRPSMREVAARLKEITAVGPDGATPKVSPLWWAELEILSTESS